MTSNGRDELSRTASQIDTVCLHDVRTSRSPWRCASSRFGGGEAAEDVEQRLLDGVRQPGAAQLAGELPRPLGIYGGEGPESHPTAWGHGARARQR